MGDGAVGKTCLFISYVTHEFPYEYVPTVFDNYAVTCTHNNKQYEVALWDTAGEEEYDRLRPLSYPDTSLFLVCYSVISPTSFENISTKWIPEISHHMPDTDFVLVGTKTDLRNDSNIIKKLEEYNKKPITTEEGRALAQKLKAANFFECSALTYHGVRPIFDFFCENIYSKQFNTKTKHHCYLS